MSWLRFVSVCLTVEEGQPLWPQIQGALAAHGEPLRWAITRATTTNGVRQLTIEAVVLHPTLTA
ncbi:MAG TPA: hypothetical protein DCQ32_09195 [Cyanobacteria bacterium UBA8156]|nr:hypothetical protein [Cyanobacteria bacterium UBA8156]